MTIQELSSYIALAIFVQVAVFVAASLRQKSRDYRQAGSQLNTGAEGVASQSLPPAVEAPSAWSGYREFRVQRKEFEDRSLSICSFYLAPLDGQPLPAFKPGQFLTFQLNVQEGTKPVIRCYSLSHAPDPECYRVSIKRIGPPPDKPDVPGGISSNFFHDQIDVGSVVAAKAPSGHFHLLDGDQSPIVLIGGGIGITPMLSMLETSLSRTPDREVWLFYGVRNGAEHIMKSRLRDLAQRYSNFHLHVCYSRPGPEDVSGADFQHASHVDIGLLRQTLNLRPYHFYICGPRQMMESLVPALADWGVDPERIHYEAFGPSTVPKLAKAAKEPSAATAATDSPRVSFAKSGIGQRWNPRADSLHEFAEDIGVSVPSGCRAGSCGSCQTTVVSGEVEKIKEPDFDVSPGCCLLCISKPKSDLVLSA